MKNTPETYHKLASAIASRFAEYPQVEAIATAGSQSTGITDSFSDIDLYVYTNKPIALKERQKIVDEFGTSEANMDLSFWDPGDEWFHAETGIEIDVMFWQPVWIENQIERTTERCEAWMGYTTSHWHTVLKSRILFDRIGWFAELQKRARKPYPDKLVKNIIAKNHPILRNVIPAYFTQIKKAISRDDFISVNHRVAAFFASYFDILFAINRVPNPGEKKLVRFAKELCKQLPDNFESDVTAVLSAAASPNDELLDKLTSMLNHLDVLLLANGIDPSTTLNL